MFPTQVWVENLDIDNEKFLEKIYKFSKTKESTPRSSVGGYQGYEMDDIEFCNKVGNLVPRKKDLGKFFIYNWVNINKKGHKNNRHFHYNSNLYMSGVYYVKVPKGDCGNIKFWDPRESLQYGNRFVLERYNGGESTERYPVEGDLWLFPSAFKHSVLPSKVDGDRICISFNLSF